MPIFNLRWQDFPDILIVAYIFYRVLMLLLGTRAMQLLRGIIIIGFVGVIANILELRSLTWLIHKLLGAFIIVIPILFQPELRHLLEELGKGRLLQIIDNDDEALRKADEMTKAIMYCKSMKIGALVVLQHNTSLKDVWRTAVLLKSDITQELLITIFWPNTPLHDGAVVIDQNQIIAAGCYLPLSDSQELPRWFGTRHRAALGVTENSDAYAMSVSEERGQVTIAVGGHLSKPLTEEQIRLIFVHYFASKSNVSESDFDSWFKKEFKDEKEVKKGGNENE